MWSRRFIKRIVRAPGARPAIPTTGSLRFTPATRNFSTLPAPASAPAPSAVSSTAAHSSAATTAPANAAVTTTSTGATIPTGKTPGVVQIHNIEKELKIFAQKRETHITLKSLMETGRGDKLAEYVESPTQEGAKTSASDKVLYQVACFLHREMPIRLARQVWKLETNPVVSQSKHILEVAKWYRKSFVELRACLVPNTPGHRAIFDAKIGSIYERHAATLLTMAKGAYELRKAMEAENMGFTEAHEVQKTLDEFYMSRIGIRMLIGQYLALGSPSSGKDSIGLIQSGASPYDIARTVISDATYICARQHGDAPEVTIHGHKDCTFPYVSSHISYILLELVKNSMRATIDTHGVDNPPPIRIIIAGGEDNEDVIIKVSDEGGGIKRSHMEQVWSYLYTTGDPVVMENMLAEESHDFDTSTPLAGLGVGLPISRNYARYFGGDLVIMSMEGYGTDSFIYLPRLGTGQSVV